MANFNPKWPNIAQKTEEFEQFYVFLCFQG